jgi:hypothetical protein
VHNLPVPHVHQREPARAAGRACHRPSVQRVRHLAFGLTAYGLCAWARQRILAGRVWRDHI